MYCDYYLENEPEFCLVAVNDDIPVGYILCSVDLDNYHEQMMENYLPMERKLSSSDYYNFLSEVKSEQRYVKQGYTAHIHMDVLEEYQDQGIDTQLLDAMQKKLAEMYVEGLFVVCSMKNERLRTYYEENGFDDIDYFGGSVVYGKKLFVED